MYEFLKSETAPKILVEAVKHLGVSEIVGPKHNQEIIDWAIYLNLDNVYKNDEIPWCGLFVAYCAKKSGLDLVKSPLWALSWSEFGTAVNSPMLGDVLTFKRDGGGHVGIYVGEDDDCYHVLGGNQGNKVSVIRIAKSRLHKARRTKWKIAQPKSVRIVKLAANGTISKNEA